MNHPANEADNEEMYSSLHTWFAPPETSITKAGIRRRAKNNYYSPEIRAKIGRYAVEHGNSLTAEKFSRELNMDVGESTVRSIKKRYLMSVQEMDTEIEALKSAPRGRPLMLGDIDKKIVQLVSEILQTGGTVNGTIVTAIAKGAVRRENKSLLRENGGHIDITRAWAQSFLTRMGLVKHKSERTAGKVAQDIGNDKSTFLDNIKKCVSKYGIPKELIINFSQVHLNIVPVSNWTTSIESLSSQTNKDLENCEVTAVLASTASGKLIPPLVLYGGETDICCPEYQFPNNWHVSHINHQWDEQSMIDYAKNVLRQYIDNIKKELGLSRTQQALIISDVYNLDQVNSIINILNEWSMIPFFVPAGYAEDLQPMDLGFNSEFRNLVQNEFCEWYAHCIEKEPDSCVNLNFKLLAPLHAGWMVKTFNTMHNNKDVILSGWKKTGILEVYDSVTSTDCGAKEAVDTNEHSVLDADINVKQEKFVT
ncbi:uncharacterized protein LOC126823474 isoform X2 [Patella vulgata]|nr:uncharacterized protein LOC126823474 isoform X2 [Patella vulgata]